MPISLPPGAPPVLDVADKARLDAFERALDGVLKDTREIVLGTAAHALAQGRALGLDPNAGMAEVIREVNRLVENGGMTRFEAVYLLSVLVTLVVGVDLEQSTAKLD